MEKGAADASHRQPIHHDTTDKEKKKKIFQTPSRRPRFVFDQQNVTQNVFIKIIFGFYKILVTSKLYTGIYNKYCKLVQLSPDPVY